jgi:hypothetical protein
MSAWLRLQRSYGYSAATATAQLRLQLWTIWGTGSRRLAGWLWHQCYGANITPYHAICQISSHTICQISSLRCPSISITSLSTLKSYHHTNMEWPKWVHPPGTSSHKFCLKTQTSVSAFSFFYRQPAWHADTPEARQLAEISDPAT